MASSRIWRRKAIVLPGRQPTVPSTLIAGIEYSLRTLSSQSAQRVSTDRLGSRMRWRVVTPPTRGSRNGLTSSSRVSAVQTVSESTSTAISPLAASTPMRIALRLPGVPVQIHFTPRVSHTCSSEGFCGPLMTTMVSKGCCSTMRASM